MHISCIQNFTLSNTYNIHDSILQHKYTKHKRGTTQRKYNPKKLNTFANERCSSRTCEPFCISGHGLIKMNTTAQFSKQPQRKYAQSTLANDAPTGRHIVHPYKPNWIMWLRLADMLSSSHGQHSAFTQLYLSIYSIKHLSTQKGWGYYVYNSTRLCVQQRYAL